MTLEEIEEEIYKLKETLKQDSPDRINLHKKISLLILARIESTKNNLDEWEKYLLLSSISMLNINFLYASIYDIEKSLVPVEERSNDFNEYKKIIEKEEITSDKLKILLNKIDKI